MALDEEDHRLFVVTRLPARLLVIDTDSGKIVQTLSAVGDCDDVFSDPSWKRIYSSGGEGAISVFQQQNPDHYKEIARIPTVKGAHELFLAGFGPTIPCRQATRLGASDDPGFRT